ncbi:MAG TPA: hypothetical protein VF659_09305 [Pyrinomonadaceae bacterium]
MEVERTKAGITAALTRWASLRRKRARIEAAQAKELIPLRDAFERQSAPVLAKYAPQLSAADGDIRQLEDAIRAAVLGATDKNGAHRFTRVASDSAVAELSTSSRRELDPRLFYDLFSPAQRDGCFWGCFNVLVGKAEKLLGAARLDEHATTRLTHGVTIKEL